MTFPMCGQHQTPSYFTPFADFASSLSGQPPPRATFRADAIFPSHRETMPALVDCDNSSSTRPQQLLGDVVFRQRRPKRNHRSHKSNQKVSAAASGGIGKVANGLTMTDKRIAKTRICRTRAPTFRRSLE